MRAAALDEGHPRRQEIVGLALELFNGWRRMCEQTVANSCQDTHMCGPHNDEECLPSWKFDDDLTAEIGTGSAPDGDEDAILGMLQLVLATKDDSPRPEWWDDVARWTYQSCRAFLEHLTVPHPTLTASNGQPLRALKLGSCWGGWDCQNPSYHAPGHYHAFRDYMAHFSPLFSTAGTAAEGEALVPLWDALIETTYLIVGDSQCDATGLVPNWFIPFQSDSAGAGTTGCSGSGTPANEFGSEASRTSWRFAAHWLMHATRVRPTSRGCWRHKQRPS